MSKMIKLCFNTIKKFQLKITTEFLKIFGNIFKKQHLINELMNEVHALHVTI